MSNFSHLQKEQKIHDETFHGDITKLSHKDRIRHLLFHLGKYAGRLAEFRYADDSVVVRPLLPRTIADMLLIILSISVVCEVPLEGARVPPFRAARLYCPWQFSGELALRVMQILGPMFKRIEDEDHGISCDYQKVFTKQIIQLFQVAICAAYTLRIDPETLIRERREEIGHP